MNVIAQHPLRLRSTLTRDAALRALESATERWLTHNLYSETCVGLSVGSLFFAWRSSWRGWGFFAPGPVFRGRLRDTPTGTELSGAFTLPILSGVFGGFVLGLSVYGGLAAFSDLDSPPGVLVRLLVIPIWCLPVAYLARWALIFPWWFLRGDITFVESRLRKALESPAA